MQVTAMIDAFRFLARLLPGLAAAAFLLPGLLPGAALAADPSTAFYNTGMADPAFKLLKALFGTLADGTASAGTGLSGLATAMKAFNSAVLVAGSVFVTYNILAATAQTAHEGQILGRRYSSLWAPLRLVVASGALVPTASGFALIQHLTIKVAVLGIGLATTVWGGVFDAVGKQEIAASSFAGKQIYPVVRGLVLNYACTEMMNEQARKGKLQPNFDKTAGAARADERGLMVVRYTWGGDSHYPAAICGALEWKQPEPPDGIAIDLGVARAIAQSHQDALAAIDGDVRTLGVSLAQYGMSADAAATAPDAAKFEELESRYGEKLTGSSVPLKSILESSRDPGSWIMAGALYMRVSTWTRFALDALENLPKLEDPHWDDVYGGSRLAGRSAAAQLNAPVGHAAVQREVVDKATRKIGNWLDNMEKGRNIRTANSGNLFEEMMQPAAFSWAVDMFPPMPMDLDFSGNRNPMVVLTTYGHQLITSGAYMMAGVASMSASGGDGGVTALAAFFGPLVSALLGAMFATGGMFSVVLPMMPYVMWVMGVFGWLILVIEAVVAGPLWAFAHLRMDGEGFAGSAGKAGYLIMLNIFLRPSLMLISLIVSSSLFFVGIQFVQATFGIAVRSAAMSGGVAGFVGLITLNVLLVGIYTSMATRAFGLIHEIPDRVMRWFGGQESSAEAGMAQQAMGQAQSIGGQIASAGESGAHRAAGVLGQGGRPGQPLGNRRRKQPASVRGAGER